MNIVHNQKKIQEPSLIVNSFTLLFFIIQNIYLFPFIEIAIFLKYY